MRGSMGEENPFLLTILKSPASKSLMNPRRVRLSCEVIGIIFKEREGKG